MSRLRDMLKEHESFRATVYDDKTGKALRPGDTLVGHPTIGFGRCLDLYGLTREEGVFLLENNIATATKQAKSFRWFRDLNEARADVIVMMLFNMGFSKFLTFRRAIAALERRQYEMVAVEMLDSAWRRQVGERAQVLARMMSTGKYPGET